jgi:hypothetical protein
MQQDHRWSLPLIPFLVFMIINVCSDGHLSFNLTDYE